MSSVSNINVSSGNKSTKIKDFIQNSKLKSKQAINSINETSLEEFNVEETNIETQETSPYETNNILIKTGATVTVATTSVLSGIIKVGEGIMDGGCWVASKATSLIGATEKTEKIKNFISTDYVEKANQTIYENTEIGKIINENSNIKYDGKISKKYKMHQKQQPH